MFPTFELCLELCIVIVRNIYSFSFKVRNYALRNPQNLVFLLYHQPYPQPVTNWAPGEDAWNQVALENENYLLLNIPTLDLPLNVAFVQVDYEIVTEGGRRVVRVTRMRITGLNRGPSLQ